MTTTLTHHSLTAESVNELLAATTAAAAEHGKAMSVAVVDHGGALQGFVRMDGAPLLSIRLAQDKAGTAASFGIPTDQWHEFIKNDPPLATGIPHVPGLVVFGGGFPLYVEGRLVGALGVSGGHYTDDMAVARAALEATGLDVA